MQIVVGEAYRMMRNEIRVAPDDQEPVDEEMFTQSLREQPIDSPIALLKEEVAELGVAEEDPICEIVEANVDDELLDDAPEADFEMPEVEMEMAECEGEVYTGANADDDELVIANDDDSNA
jgi:hypothetical protein